METAIREAVPALIALREQRLLDAMRVRKCKPS